MAVNRPIVTTINAPNILKPHFSFTKRSPYAAIRYGIRSTTRRNPSMGEKCFVFMALL
jgi:hypothetical protein